MSKKNIVLILLLICFLTIMIMSVFGMMPEFSDRVPVNSVSVYDTTNKEVSKTTTSGKREFKQIELIKSKTNDRIVYAFSVAIFPENATDLTLTFEVIQGEEHMEINEVEFEEFITLGVSNYTEKEENRHYYKIELNQEQSLILFRTNKQDTRKNLYVQMLFIDKAPDQEIEKF